MSSTTDKALKLDLSQYTPVSTSEKVDRSGWVNFGADNLLPVYITELAQSSPIHGALCISISDMIAGKGLQAGQYQNRVDALNVYAALARLGLRRARRKTNLFLFQSLTQTLLSMSLVRYTGALIILGRRHTQNLTTGVRLIISSSAAR